MSYSVSEFGGLAVAFSPTDEKAVQRALARLDRGLFLDCEVEPCGPRGPYVYLVVKHWIGSAVPPIPILEWRDNNGPWPLTMEIVERVKRQEGGMENAVASALKHNEAIRQKSVDTVGEKTHEVVMANGKSAMGKRSVVLPRSQSLRQARDRARARGKNV